MDHPTESGIITSACTNNGPSLFLPDKIGVKDRIGSCAHSPVKNPGPQRRS